ncbi:hypothetical protein PGTUg99_004765 [Puccinia graminis f. sp. tritici]|uniref:Uncharacterized protein n=1 Tax=Puccinia graminis f. sp. tritici TaxID=56615 RepID=A0A5B0QGX4_PUCGR|nr:hypothetical protein PGTUg99_004765 [Puccinia graminis f. sp. tritici]
MTVIRPRDEGGHIRGVDGYVAWPADQHGSNSRAIITQTGTNKSTTTNTNLRREDVLQSTTDMHFTTESKVQQRMWVVPKSKIFKRYVSSVPDSRRKASRRIGHAHT